MPITVSQSENVTTLVFAERCAMDDVAHALPQLKAALQDCTDLRFDTAEAQSVDTAVVQFALSAAQSASTFHSHDDPFFNDALKRWGIPALTKP
ncbi:hypothetical protein [Pelagicoccus sp. SDUM812003]|uniref:hypothetical protein n=1 Tax=Pelagicoccus sp. SDUM812003 TaxID=3041267 RepID=UPI00280F1539|nr:hypothetical protein [Pelagicoccus sp. SDUM812003]MDQ8204706.1 hypothetical protein [Pelagicoccus sp. SDUM812003]